MLLSDGMRFPPADLNTPVSNQQRSLRLVQLHPIGPMPYGGDAERQVVFQQHPSASLQRADDAAILPLAVALLDPATSVRLLALAYRCVALAGIAAETERLQVADGIRAALVFGDDGVHLQSPLVRRLLSNSLAPQHSQRPRAHVSTRTVTEPLIGVR